MRPSSKFEFVNLTEGILQNQLSLSPFFLIVFVQINKAEKLSIILEDGK